MPITNAHANLDVNFKPTGIEQALGLIGTAGRNTS